MCVWCRAASADCSRHLDAGNFSSPGFPDSLPVSPLFCEWIVDSPAGHQVQLQFHVVDLPQLAGHGRQVSYLSFGDFNLLGQRVEYRRVYGRRTPLPTFTSSRQSAWVTLVSTGDPTGQHQGLLIQVTYLPYGQRDILYVSCWFVHGGSTHEGWVKCTPCKHSHDDGKGVRVVRNAKKINMHC